ncbi:hypothetical protein VI817_010473 [Penicillium citrinum]|nr:hypothetical protein VI817_010473 [Penicillium citrinum]
MPFFKKKSSASPQPQSSNSFARSVENLVHPAFISSAHPPPPLAAAAPPPPSTTSTTTATTTTTTTTQGGPPEYETIHHFQPPRFIPPESSKNPKLSQPEVQSSLHRSQSQRQPHLQQRDRPTIVAPELQPQPRQKRGLFVRPSSGILDRASSVSIKGKSISHPISQPVSPQVSYNTSAEHVARISQEDQSTASLSYEPRSTSLVYQQQQRQLQQQQQQQNFRQSRDQIDRSQYPSQQIDQPYRRPLARSNTDPNLLDQLDNPSPTEPGDSTFESSQPQFQSQFQSQSSQLQPQPQPHPYEGYRGQPPRSQQDLVLNARPPSRQSYEPLSPIRSQTHPDAMQQASAQVPNDQQSETSSRRGSATSRNMPDQPGRQTPTSNTRSREDLGDIDVRALLQKHEELRMYTSASYYTLLTVPWYPSVDPELTILQRVNTPR